MSSGETADEPVTEPRQTEGGLAVLQEVSEGDFAPEFGERDAGLGAQAEVWSGRLLDYFVRERLGRSGFAQDFQRLHDDLAVGVIEQGQ